jgi:hypothetical protein
MIKAWNKDGKLITKPDKDSIGEHLEKDTQSIKMVLAVISQEYKEIITKVEIETDDFKMMLEQK